MYWDIKSRRQKFKNLPARGILSKKNEKGKILPFEWEALDQQRKKIKNFLFSLNAKSIGSGLVYYNEENFTLPPRSNWFNGWLLQKIVSLFEKGASFEKTREAFVELIKCIDQIKYKISTLQPQQAEREAADQFFLNWHDIPRAGRFLNFWRRDFMSQYIAEIAANLDKFARSSNELGRKRCR